jgi:simple sugar transport system substrate-binding protein
MKRKIAVFFLSVVLFGLMLNACKDQSENSGQKNDKTYVIATVPKLMAAAWFIRMNEGVKQFAGDTGVDAYMTGPDQSDAALQVQYIEDLISSGVNALCIIPYSVEALEPVLKKAREQGIIVVTHEAEGMVNTDVDIEAFDNAAYGEHIMKNLAAAMGSQGEYVVSVADLTSKSHNQWVDAAIAFQILNYPKMKHFGDKLTSNDKNEDSYAAMKEVLRANPNILGYQGSSMQDIPGAALAIEEAGLSGKIKMAGTCLVSVSGDYIRNGTVDTISFWDPAMAGYAMNVIALKLLKGGKVTTGDDLGIEGYTNLIYNSDLNTLYGNAWIDVNIDNVNDPQYAF